MPVGSGIPPFEQSITRRLTAFDPKAGGLRNRFDVANRREADTSVVDVGVAVGRPRSFDGRRATVNWPFLAGTANRPQTPPSIPSEPN
jgi:hypothetical protein